MQRRNHRLLLPASAIVAVLVSGCSSSSDSADEEFDPGLVWSELAFLTEGISQEDMKAATIEQQDSTAQCMKKEIIERYRPQIDAAILKYGEKK